MKNSVLKLWINKRLKKAKVILTVIVPSLANITDIHRELYIKVIYPWFCYKNPYK